MTPKQIKRLGRSTPTQREISDLPDYGPCFSRYHNGKPMIDYNPEEITDLELRAENIWIEKRQKRVDTRR